MSVTTTPYGASTTSNSYFSCLLSDPDTGELNNIVQGRHVPRSSTDSSLTLPAGNSVVPIPQSNSVQISLLPTPDAVNAPYSQGVYYCEATSRALTTRVPVTILANNSKNQELICTTLSVMKKQTLLIPTPNIVHLLSLHQIRLFVL